MARDPNWSYIAGFFDGEGCISIRGDTNRKLKRCQVTIVQKNPEPLVRIKKFLGYGRVLRRKDNACSTLVFSRHSEVLHFIRGVLPYAIVKRQQFLKIKEFIEMRSSLTAKQQEEYVTLLKLLKRNWIPCG